MHDVNGWLMTLAFLLGLLLTLALTIRKVTREVPVTHTVSAGIAKPHLDKPDVAKVAGVVTATGAAAAAGAAAKLHGAADKVEQKVVRVEQKVVRVDETVEHVLENDPYGPGSIRVSARTVAPVGYTIKGDKDTGRYFTLDSPEYEAIEAEVWFADEASAAKAGFLRWDGEGGRKFGLIGAETVVTETHVASETMITERHSTADSSLVIVDDGIPEARTVIVDDGITETTIRIIGADD
jgi:uncharacterized membrane protein ArfC